MEIELLEGYKSVSDKLWIECDLILHCSYYLQHIHIRDYLFWYDSCDTYSISEVFSLVKLVEIMVMLSTYHLVAISLVNDVKNLPPQYNLCGQGYSVNYIFNT